MIWDDFAVVTSIYGWRYALRADMEETEVYSLLEAVKSSDSGSLIKFHKYKI